MKLKKMIPELVAGIVSAGYDKEPKEIQSLSIPKIKSGTDLFMVAPEGAGKTTALVIGIIQQLKSAQGEAPRAIIMAPSKDKAFEIEEMFNLLGKQTGLRVFTVFDQGILQYQKDMIYEGIDVLVGTQKRLMELVGVMGVPVINVKMFVVDDVQSISLNNYGNYIYRLADSLGNAQFIITADEWSSNLERISERIMKSDIVVSVRTLKDNSD